MNSQSAYLNRGLHNLSQVENLDLPEERIFIDHVLFQFYWNQIRVKRRQDLSLEVKRNLFLAAASRFLEDDDTILALDNQQLYNDLLATNNSVKAGLKVGF